MRDGPITKNQFQYICILSSYDDTKVEDIGDIVSFLTQHGKKSLKELTKAEASDLIQLLLKRPAAYKFPCGATKKNTQERIQQHITLGRIFRRVL